MKSRLPMTIVTRAALGCIACLNDVAAFADAPPRSESGQTLVVPPEHLDLGEIYHISPGQDAQWVCTSDGLLQKTVATCRRIVGYVVVPWDREDDDPPIVAGACRIPVASLLTGSSGDDATLHGPQLLNAAEHPEIAFVITAVREARLVSDAGEPNTYALTIAGQLTLMGKPVEMELAVQVTILPFSRRTMMGRHPGDLLTLRCDFERSLADLGLSKPRQANDRIADRLKFDVFLLANTIPPDKSLDPSIRQRDNMRYHQFLTLVRDLNRPADGYAFGRGFARDAWGDAQVLDRLANATLSEDGIRTRDFRFVEKLAQRANELTEYKDASMLVTLAKLHVERGNLRGAIKWQAKAVERLEGVPPPVAERIRATLQEYQSLEKADAESEAASP